jgi:hypothetical protein
LTNNKWFDMVLSMKTRDFVIIKNTNSDLDGRDGYLLGKSINGMVKIWIVELIGPIYIIEGEEYLAVTLPESCLEVME